MIWLTGGGFVISLAMVIGLVALVAWKGSTTFWPPPVERFTLVDGRALMGEISRAEMYRPRPDEIEGVGEAYAQRAKSQLEASGGASERWMVRTGNFDVSGSHFTWISDFQTRDRDRPEWAIVVERLSWGRFYGFPARFEVDGEAVAEEPAAVWAEFLSRHSERRAEWRRRVHLERHEIGALNRRIERSRLDARRAAMEHGVDSPEHVAARGASDELAESLADEYKAIDEKIAVINREDARHALVLRTADGQEKSFPLSEIVRAYPANRLGFGDKLGVYASRWREFLLDEPREANSEGGVFPAIFGTVTMTMLMSVAVVPFGILAALYMREYARGGLIISAVRIAVNNLAGVPSIVFGVFGLGFFCYFVGGGIDGVFFKERLPSPTFGTGGVMWAAFTLALLTLPVVIVATEEALAAVPRSMREGSYGCGASKWQTIWRIVLPRAMPGIMTGAILAMARGAGEVAPLMLVGAVKLAPELPIDSVAPFVHPQRSFMHLGFHIYDLGFQSQNSEAAKPMVYTTTLLLILVIATLNLAAIWLRARLSRRFRASQF
jgi:phosphate transport system permease protein